MIRRSLLLLTLAAAFAFPATAAAQDTVGAGRVELNTAVFGGGMLFTRPSTADANRSRSYVLSGAATANINHHVGVEGDVAVALGRPTAHEVFGTITPNPRTPNMLLSSANLIYNPFASDRRVVPYLSAGIGALNVFGRTDAVPFGLAPRSAHLMGSAGGGVRWFAIPHWGVRVDYRYVGIRNDADAAIVGAPLVTSAHRVYAALIATF